MTKSTTERKPAAAAAAAAAAQFEHQSLANADAAASLVRFAENAAQHLVSEAAATAKRLLADTEEVADAHRLGNGEIMRRLDSIDSKLERMDKLVIVGNGQPSLISRVTIMETAQGRITIASVVTGIGMVGTLALTYFNK